MVRLVAVDLGAESGRIVVGDLEHERLTLKLARRFANRPLWLPDGLHWNLPSLFVDTLEGLKVASARGSLDAVGVDAWGCDYALLDRDGRMLGLPFHYRDARTGQGPIDAVHARVSRDELYARTGIQTMPINTVFQLQADLGGSALDGAERIALIPDLIAFWLTGMLANEITAASTTGLLEVGGDRFACDLIARLGLPVRPFERPAVSPGTRLGPILESHRAQAGDATGAMVYTVAAHDTASAFAAAPIADEHAGVLSSGTWSLLGVESPRAQVGELAAAYNLTNERGVAGSTRLLRNVMGLWLLQECRRVWAQAGGKLDYRELQALAREARRDVPLFDPDDATLLHGGDMPSKIARLCALGGQAPPSGAGEVCRSIMTSLACRYRLVLDQLQEVTGNDIQVVHVVGGGARNELLCQLTADIVCRPLLAGPVEATAIGNLLVQAIAIGALESLERAREVARRSVRLRVFEPGDTHWGDATFQRFMASCERGSVAASKAAA